MLLKPKSVRNCTEDFENEILIEKWMKRNSSEKVTNIVLSGDSNKTVTKISNAKHVSLDENKHTPIEISMKKLSESTSIKRTCTTSPINVIHDVIPQEVIITTKKRKVIRTFIPSKSIELQLINKNTTTKPINRISDPGLKILDPKLSKRLSQDLVQVKNFIKNKAVNQNFARESALATQCHTSSTIGTKKMENDTCTKNSIRNLLCNEKDTDVYTSLLENYRYLITPKSWSVTELTSETKDRCIVFFIAQVIKENDTWISVMRKSLIIDKGATMNYSVHGLPVDIKGTILPKILDNTKKLLSILHIFDKMQVCEGLGSDLNIMQTDFVFKDICRYWRHKHCKIVLIKATRCPICTETRNLLLERKNTFKRDLVDSLNL